MLYGGIIMEKLILITIPTEKFESSEYDVFLAPWVKLIKATEDFLFVSVPESKRFDLFSYIKKK